MKSVLFGIQVAAAAWLIIFSGFFSAQAGEVSINYSGGFHAGDLNLNNLMITDNGNLSSLSFYTRGPESIMIPFDQSVSVTFISEGSGYTKNDFGWFFANNVVLKGDGTADFPAMAANGVIHEVYSNINDNNGNGVLDKSGSDLSNRYGDTNGDGKVDVLDNTVTLGTFAGGTELVFYLKVDDQSRVFYTKTAWNPDTYGTMKDTLKDAGNKKLLEYDKTYQLGIAGGERFRQSDGWLTQTTLDRLKNDFGIQLSDSAIRHLKWGQKYPHVIGAHPSGSQSEWIIGWDDQRGDGCAGPSPVYPSCSTSNADMDHNDMVFKVDFGSRGTATLRSDAAMTTSSPDEYFTRATIEVWDRMLSDKDAIVYSVSADNGSTWIPISSWDTVLVSDDTESKGAAVANWTPGNPQYTYRSATVNFAGGIRNRILWKAEFTTQGMDEPELLNLKITAAYEKPQASMMSVSSVKATTAIAAATAVGDGITERGFFWWNDAGFTSGTVPAGSGSGDFSLMLNNLTPLTTYYISAYIKTGGQPISSGNKISFTTTASIFPTVITASDFTVNGNEVSVKGEITDVGSSPVKIYGFVYALHTAPTVWDMALPFTGDITLPISAGKPFEGTIKNLAIGTYYFRAYANNSQGTAYGEEFSFTISSGGGTGSDIPGDLNKNGSPDLADVILILKILDNIPVDNVNLKTDVNGDGKIGHEEAVFVLQKAGMLR